MAAGVLAAAEHSGAVNEGWIDGWSGSLHRHYVQLGSGVRGRVWASV